MKLIMTAFIALFVTVLSAQEMKPEIIKVGDTAPLFSIKTIDGETFNSAALKGKVIYLNFFATWCGPCMKEMPHIEKDIWLTLKHPDFVMLCIAREQTLDEIIKFKRRKGYTLPMAADTNRAIYDMFAPQYIPRNIVIDRNGKIIYTEKNYTELEFSKLVKTIKSELN